MTEDELLDHVECRCREYIGWLGGGDEPEEIPNLSVLVGPIRMLDLIEAWRTLQSIPPAELDRLRASAEETAR